jgi:hypothetical protein
MFMMATTAEYRAQALGSFLAMVVIVVGALLGAIARPRQVGHTLAGLFGVAALIGGLAAFPAAPQLLLPLVLVTIGGATLLMTYYSIQRSRPAWSFLLALLAVMVVCTLFGAPKIRGILGLNMWVALMVPGLLAVTCTALGMVADDYREPVGATRRPR